MLKIQEKLPVNKFYFYISFNFSTNFTAANFLWLIFDFSSNVGTAYNRLVIIPDFEERSQTNISYFDQISFGSTANLESFLVDNIDIFPNPAKNQFNLSSNLNNSLGIQIFDVLGKSVKKLHTNKKSINISDLNSGIYFVRIKNGDYYVTKKLIIN